MTSVEFQSVSKSYAVYHAPEDRLKELVTLNRWKRHRDFRALRDVSVEVGRGGTFGIIGENGSGKSTLLEIVAGILPPTAFDGTLDDSSICDWIDNAIALQMGRSASEVYGYLHLPCRVEVNARMRQEPAEVGRLVEKPGA